MVANEASNGARLKIPLQLDGIFSCFETCKLTEDEVEACEHIPTVNFSLLILRFGILMTLPLLTKREA